MLAKIAHHRQVRYRYKELPNNESLTLNDLAAMPQAWKAKFEQAELSIDEQQMKPIIEHIPPKHSNFPNNLKHLIENFCFNQLLNLT